MLLDEVKDGDGRLLLLEDKAKEEEEDKEEEEVEEDERRLPVSTLEFRPWQSARRITKAKHLTSSLSVRGDCVYPSHNNSQMIYISL